MLPGKDDLKELFDIFAEVTSRYVDISRQGYTPVDAICDVLDLVPHDRALQDSDILSFKEDELHIWCDGGSRGNPGPSYHSFVAKLPDGTVHYRSPVIQGGVRTNNEAEYDALITALSWAVDEASNLVIHMDSQVVLNHVLDRSGVGAKFKPFLDKVRELLGKFESVEFRFISGDEMKRILGH